MSLSGLSHTSNVNQVVMGHNKIRRSVENIDPAIMADVYEEDVNIAIWRRTLSESLKTSAHDFLISNPSLKSRLTVTTNSLLSDFSAITGLNDHIELRDDIAELVDMFCYLFGLKVAGLRLTVLSKAMCPKFHVDTVPCRLLTTYQGIATEWLPHCAVNRQKLGTGSNGLADYQSGIYQNESDIQQLEHGDVALLKGELWDGNENAGLVHRSPSLAVGERRLLLTLDFST